MEERSQPRQLTTRGVALGILLSAALAGANAYLGLFAGMTVSASIPAAVISMGLLRWFRTANILENNIVQTSTSAGESLAAGVIFTIPALVIMGYWERFDYLWVTLIAGTGGLLGVLFTIPLRRALVVEEGLAFPEGTATAEVLRVGHRRGGGAQFLAWGGLAGGLAKLATTGLRLWKGTTETAAYVGGSAIGYVGTSVSPALLSVGYIVGLNIAVLVFVGGAIAWLVILPVYSAVFLPDSELAQKVYLVYVQENLVEAAGKVWGERIRYIGVGAMVVGGLWALISMRKSLWRGVRSGLRQYARRDTSSVAATERDTPMPFVLVAVGLFVVPVFLLYQFIDASITVGISVPVTGIMIVAGFLFSAVAAYMAGLVGSSNNPVSGITIATILFAALMLLGLMGREAQVGAAAAIMVGAVVCCGAAIGGDNMQDLKAGYLVGATPWKQQVVQGVGVVSAALVVAPILNLLHEAYGIGAAAGPDALPAPQATLMASVASGVFGAGLPWAMVTIGGVLGGVVIAIDEWLKAKGASWRAPVLAIAVGTYLPLELSVPIFVGGVVAYLAKRRHRDEASAEPSVRDGVLFAAGLITGEALVGILLAVPIVMTGKRDVLAVMVGEAPIANLVGGLPGLAVLAALVVALHRIAGRRVGG